VIIDAAQLTWRHSQRISGVRDKKVYIGPETVTLNVNAACNLSCRFCGPQEPADWGSQPKKSDFYQWEKFTGVVRDCVELNVDQIQFMGGEPTIHPLFRKMMHHLEDKPLYVKIFTNATFPSDYCSDVIRADHLVVNLSAADQQRYLALKGKDLFDQVISNVKRLGLLTRKM
jgi:molybdenum cofactor biosynthesis enzyme MoaA